MVEYSRDGNILKCIAVIANRRGLHARAAAKFVKLASGFDAEITVSKRGQTVSGRSILGLMMLAAGPGTEIEIAAVGREAEDAIESLGSIIEARFDED
ncbi:HPr family phosphocarrier protein [Defluviicoccus vanus]|uniref:HPr family phosphocarrier protein n=1 Tax=Defluviicoccus vanus TaxID=111831 RepID=A0A7H1N5Z5_9PROT|nr:HPr family phosphocarrier protein [Defluviicoccus vanus]QNT71131.1 HPr family phosphocarrier protein [Defluviicoccus vanus]